MTTYFVPLLNKLGHEDGTLQAVRAQLGQWVIRAGPLAIPPQPMPAPVDYWNTIALHMPLLAKVALTIFSISASEACVERSFSHQSLLHTDLRNSLDDTSIQATQHSAQGWGSRANNVHCAATLMVVRMNVPRMFNIPTLPSAKKARVEE